MKCKCNGKETTGCGAPLLLHTWHLHEQQGVVTCQGHFITCIQLLTACARMDLVDVVPSSPELAVINVTFQSQLTEVNVTQ